MKIEKAIDQIHTRVTNNRYLQLFTSFTRIILAVGFIPPSIPKIMHQPFTLLPDSNPVGHYFNALYQTGFYYQFIGWGQIIAAILLLIPRTSHLGALMFFPIILNITVLTNSVGFKGTWLVTIFMFLACLYLVCWDYPRWKNLIFTKNIFPASTFKYQIIWLPLLFGVGSLTAYVVFAFLILQTISTINPLFLVVMAVLGSLFGLVVALHHKYMTIGDPTASSDLTA